jgi:hypothetical protein
MGFKWFIFLIRLLYLIGMWVSEHQRTNVKKHMFKRDWITLSNVNNYSTLNSAHNREGPMYPIKKSTNMQLQ